MGLDTYAMRLIPADDKDFEGLNLCGGIFSSSGSGFRGKVYESFIQWVTGDEQTLYKRDQGIENITEIYNQLQLFMKEHPDEEEAQVYLNMLLSENWIDYSISLQEVKDLIKFFKICIDKDYRLHGWW